MKQETEVENKSQNYIEAGMITAAFDFWFSDTDHLRSPFPIYIREKLKNEAIAKFVDWGNKISEKAKKEINDEILAEKLEEIIFELALKMVRTEDEKLTVRYPFMIRLGDAINVKDAPIDEAESLVIDRHYVKRADNAFLKVKLKNTATNKEWETEFELPE